MCESKVLSSAPPQVLPFAAPTFNGAHPAKKAVLMNKGRVPVISLPSEGLEALARATRARWAVDAEEPPPPRPYRELLMAVQLAARGGMDAAAAWARPGGRDDSGTRRDRAEASHWFYLDAQGKEQVRKTPSWPRSWANCSLLWLYSHRNAWANLHLLGQLNNFLARQGPFAGAQIRLWHSQGHFHGRVQVLPPA